MFQVSNQDFTVAKQCTSPGNFLNDLNGTCESYTLCLTAGVDRYIQLNLTCPDGFLFNHFDKRCTNNTSYQCVPDFNCTEIGNFSNPFDINCTTYIDCVAGLSDIITARSIACQMNQIFDPKQGLCVNSNETAFACLKNPSTSLGDVFVNIFELHESSNKCNSYVPNSVLISAVTYLMIF
jgi:hypothetical protein